MKQRKDVMEYISVLTNEKKNQFLISQMVSYTNVDTELNINTIEQRENKQNILFLERYPALAVRHTMGLSWGTTSPR